MKSLSKKILTLSILIICSLLLPFTAQATDSVYGEFTGGKFLTEATTSPYHEQAIRIDNVRYFTLPSLATVLNHTPSQFDFKWLPEQQAIAIQKGVSYSGEPDTWLRTEDKPYRIQPNKVQLLIDNTSYVLDTFLYNNKNYFNPNDFTTLLNCRFLISPDEYDIAVYPNIDYRHLVVPDAVGYDSRISLIDSRWASPVFDSAFVDSMNQLNTFSASDNLYLTTYDTALTAIETKKVPLEMPHWGGFYSGSKYNFLVIGQSNKEEDNKKEVIRVTKYDKNLKQLDSLAITGGMCFTTVPFDAGSLRMQEIGNKLIIHTSRERYKSSDGLNHQSQLTIIIDIEKMKVVNNLELFQPNHVSHSFNQFVLQDGNKHVLLDHGDAYPRSIVLQAENGSKYQEVDLFKIPGKIGANATGVSVGDFEMSKDHYIAAFSSIDHSLAKSYTDTNITGLNLEQRHVMISSVPKNSLSDSSVKQQMIMDYTGTSKTATPPYLVKLSEEHLLLMWQERDFYVAGNTIRYICLDNAGNACTPVKSLYGSLSFCKPILYNGAVTWFLDLYESRLIYRLPLEDILPN